MKKFIIALMVVVMVVCCLSFVACNSKENKEILKNYIFDKDNTSVEADFVLPLTISEKEVEWKSNNSAVTLEKRSEDWLAKVTRPEEGEEVVTLTLKLGKESVNYTVRVKAIDVYSFVDNYEFPKNKATVVETFELKSTWDYKGKTATIAWSVPQQYELYIKVSEDGTKCEVTPQTDPTEVEITATFTYNGVSASKSYPMTVYTHLEGLELVDYWYSNTGVSIDMSGYVVEIGTAYSKDYNNITLYMVNDDLTAGYYLYRVKTDDAKAEKIKPGVHVTVTGTTNTDYNGLIETNAGGALVVDDKITPIDLSTTIKAVDDLVIGSLPATIYNESRLVSLTGWTVKKIDETQESSGTKIFKVAGQNFTLMTLEKGGVEVDIRISKYLEGAYLTEKENEEWNALCALTETYPVGSVINVTGIFSKYKDTWQIMPLNAEAVTAGVADEEGTVYAGATVSKAVAAVNKAIADNKLNTRIQANAEFTLPTENNGVTITYAVSGSSNAIVIDGGKMTVTPGNPENTRILVTYAIDDFTTEQYIFVKSLIPTAATMLEDLEVPGKIGEVVSLPTVPEGAEISWSIKSETTSLVIENGQMIPTLSEEDVAVIISAEITYKGDVRSKDYVTIIKAGKDAVLSEAPFEEDKAYVLAVKQGNLDKTIYAINKISVTTSGEFLLTTDNYEEAQSVYVELVEDNYRLYFKTKEGKSYLSAKIGKNSKDVDTPYLCFTDSQKDAQVWTWDAQNKCFCAELTIGEAKETYYFGTYSKYDTISLSKKSYVSTSFPAFLGQIEFVPLTVNTIKVADDSSENASVELSKTEAINGVIFTFTVSVDEGYDIVSVKVNGANVSANEAGVYTGIVKGATTVKVETRVQGEEPVGPTLEHAGTEADPFTVADVLAILESLQKGETYSANEIDTYYIKGYVITGTYSTQYKNFDNFTIGDTANATTTVVCFRPKMADGVTEAKVGDLVVLKGKIQWFANDTTDSKQVASGAQIVSVEAGESPTPSTLVKAEAPFEEGKAYYLAINQTNLNKTIYAINQIANYFGVTVDSLSNAQNVYVEKDGDNYFLYFTNGTTKTYISFAVSGTHANYVLVTENAKPWIWDAENNCFKTSEEIAPEGKEAGYYFIGTYNNYETCSLSHVSTLTTNFPAYLGEVKEGGEVVPPTPEHTCAHVCPTCGKCTDATCTDTACADKCQGHEDIDAAEESMAIIATEGALAEDGLSISWTSENFVITNSKNISKNDIVTTNYDHFRCYVGSTLEISAKGDKKIVKVVLTFTVANYSGTIEDYNISGVTAVVQDSNIVVTVNGSVSSLLFTMTKQLRVSNIVIYYVEDGGEVVVPPTPEHTCAHVCPTCGKCTDATCEDEACADKCQGHEVVPPTPDHVCAHVCPTCGKCTDADCADEACADKCQGHEVVNPDPIVVTVAEAIELEDGTKVIVSGVVTVINGKWNEQYSNMNVTITDAEGNSLYVYRLATQVGLGDTITITGEMATHNGRQIGAGATATIDEVHVCTKWTEADCSNAGKCVVCGQENPEMPALGHIDEDEDGFCDRCEAKLSLTKVATFTFGENGEAKHIDGDNKTTEYSETNNGYTLELADLVKVSAKATDIEGTSCLKLGTTSATASFSFTVADDVNVVVIRVSAYKANFTQFVINGETYDVPANEGTSTQYTPVYMEITINVSTNKTVEVSTTDAGKRAMIDSIDFYA